MYLEVSGKRRDSVGVDLGGGQTCGGGRSLGARDHLTRSGWRCCGRLSGSSGCVAAGPNGPVTDVARGAEVQARRALELLEPAPQAGVVALAVTRHAAVRAGRAALARLLADSVFC